MIFLMLAGTKLLLLLSVTDKKIRNGLIRGFIKQGFAALEKYANKTVDTELLGKLLIVRTYGHLLMSHIPMIRAKCINDNFLAGKYIHCVFHCNDFNGGVSICSSCM